MSTTSSWCFYIRAKKNRVLDGFYIEEKTRIVDRFYILVQDFASPLPSAIACLPQPIPNPCRPPPHPPSAMPVIHVPFPPTRSLRLGDGDVSEGGDYVGDREDIGGEGDMLVIEGW